jgi:hypothetical protein
MGTEQTYRSASEGHLQPTWYPNSFDKEGSTPIMLSPGQEISGLEVRLRPSATHRIRGTVLGLDNLPPNPQARAVGRNLNVLASSGSSDAPRTYSAQPRPNGSFEIQGVPSGEYDVGVSQPFLPVGLGRVKVRVDDRDVDGISIDVSRTHPLKGTLRFEGNEDTRMPGLLITLTNLDLVGGTQLTRTLQDGSFEFPITTPGRYRVWVPAPSEEYFLKPVRYQNQESRSGIISLSEGDGPLELVLSKGGARLAVNVKRGDAAPSTVAARVVLIPDTDNSEERGFGAQQAVPDQNGAMSINSIPPGKYRLFAFESVPDDAWVDAEFWKDIRGKGVELSVSEGESKNAEATLVLQSEIVALLSRLGME